VSGGLHHAAGGAGRADVPALARERDQKIMTATGAIDSGETVGQDATSEEIAEGGLDVTGDA